MTRKTKQEYIDRIAKKLAKTYGLGDAHGTERGTVIAIEAARFFNVLHAFHFKAVPGVQSKKRALKAMEAEFAAAFPAVISAIK